MGGAPDLSLATPTFIMQPPHVFFLQLLVKNLQFEDGKMIPASKYFSSGESSSVELTDEEKKMAAEIKVSNLH